MRDARLWETRLWDGFCEKHAYERRTYERHAYEIHAYDRFTGLSDKQALVVVNHVREEVPGIVNEWLRLPGEEEVAEKAGGGKIR
jgi:hypothetical protein